MRLKAALISKPSSTQASETDRSLRNVPEHPRPPQHTLTVDSQGEVTAVKLVLGGDLTSVCSSEISSGCQDLHLKRVDLHEAGEHGGTQHRQGGRLGFAEGHLGGAVERLLQLQVFPGLAGEIHPLPFEPFNGGLLQQRLLVHFGHKRDVLTCADEEDLIDSVDIHTNTLETKWYHKLVKL